MKLYLSSKGVPDGAALLSLLDGRDLSAVIVPNAWDVYPASRRQEELEKIEAKFVSLGFVCSFTDLGNASGKELKATLLECSVIWVMGGNSFYLNELVTESGLSEVLRELLIQGLVYGGESAGAVLAGPTLHGVENLDDPEKASEVIWNGLGLVDFGIVPHWGLEKYADSLEKCKTEMEKYSQVKAITNDQVIVVNDGSVKVVGG